jgi:hypothetical protein
MTLYSDLTALDFAARAAGRWFSEHLSSVPSLPVVVDTAS